MSFTSKLRDNLGYFMIDHRASPGISQTQAELTPGMIPVGEGNMFERDIKTCIHCQAVVVLNPLRTRPRNWCAKCDKYICDSPICNMECRPYVKMLDDLDKQDKLTITL